MESWEEARINRLEDRLSRLERKDWERRDFFFRLIMNSFAAAMIALSIAAIVLSAVHAAH
jgi:hypothetical protein